MNLQTTSNKANVEGILAQSYKLKLQMSKEIGEEQVGDLFNH